MRSFVIKLNQSHEADVDRMRKLRKVAGQAKIFQEWSKLGNATGRVRLARTRIAKRRLALRRVA